MNEPLGVELVGLDPWDSPADAAAALAEAVAEHRVAIARLDRPLRDEGFLALARCFGELVPTTDDEGRRRDLLTVLTDERSGRAAPEAGWPAAGLPWHTDYAHLPRVVATSYLVPVELPPDDSGVTSFLDMAATWAALSAGDREAIRAHTIHWNLAPSVAAEYGFEPGPLSSSLVRELPDGTEVLWLGPSWGTIDDLDGAATAARRRELTDLALEHGRRYDHHWSANDLVVFDNQAVLHHRAQVTTAFRREMQQISTWAPDGP